MKNILFFLTLLCISVSALAQDQLLLTGSSASSHTNYRVAVPYNPTTGVTGLNTGAASASGTNGFTINLGAGSGLLGVVGTGTGAQLILNGNVISGGTGSGGNVSHPGTYSDLNVGTSGTAWALGLKTLSVSGIPGWSASGTNCAALINKNFSGGYIHDVHLILDQNFNYEVSLLTGDNAWIEFAPGVTITGGTNCYCPAIQNAHRVYVNLSGSANTITPLLSATASRYDDINVKVSGMGLINGNRQAQTIFAGAYPLFVNGTNSTLYTVYGSGTGALLGERCVMGVDFSGVKNLDLEDFSIINQCTFAVYMGNCRNVTKRNITVYKPALSATNNQYAAYDDNFHDDGSVYNEFDENLYAIDNSDNCFAWNPGDYWTTTQAFQGGVGNTGTYMKCQYDNCGPDVNIRTHGLYSNGQGPGWFCDSLAGTLVLPQQSFTGVASDIEHSDFEGMYLDNPNPFRAEAVQSNTFGPNAHDVKFRNWYIGGKRGTAYAGSTQYLAIGGSLSYFRIEDITCANFTDSGLPFIDLCGGNTATSSSSVTITGCFVTGTGLISSSNGQAFLAVGGDPATGIVANTLVSNNIIVSMGDVVADATVTAGLVSGLGGSGNMILNPSLGAKMYNIPAGVAGVSGQFQQTFGQQYAASYQGTVALTGGTSVTQGGVAVINAQNAVSVFIQGLQNLGLYQNCLGMALALNQNNNSVTAPVFFGGLNNGLGVYQFSPGGTSIGTAGLLLSGTQYVEYTGMPTTLATGSANTILSVVTSNSNSGATSTYINLGYPGAGGVNGGLLIGRNPGVGSDFPFLIVGGPSPAIVTSVTNSIINRPCAYWGVVNGTNGTLETIDVTGSIDTTSTGAVSSGTNPTTAFFLHHEGDQVNGPAGVNDIIHTDIAWTSAFSPAQKQTVYALWQLTLGQSYYLTISPTVTGTIGTLGGDTDIAVAFPGLNFGDQLQATGTGTLPAGITGPTATVLATGSANLRYSGTGAVTFTTQPTLLRTPHQ